MPESLVTPLSTFDVSDLGLPIHWPRPVRLSGGRTIAEGPVQPAITSKELQQEFAELTGIAPGEFSLPLRILAFEPGKNDEVIVATENKWPLVVRRDEDVIVNFDISATQAFQFPDSRRPMYTYLPCFNIQKVPTALRRPVSNLVQSLRAPRGNGDVTTYRRLPLTSFEFVVLLLNRILVHNGRPESRLFQWPRGKRSVFISLHDVDTGGFLRRQERDALFRLERKHDVRSTWFIPTEILKERRDAIDFLLQSGNEVGWHGYNHDHRLPFRPFAERRVQRLASSYFARPENFPTGMRTPKLLKSNHLFDVLARTCPALRYDTSFLWGIVPYPLWVNGRRTRILEIPTTVPTDIRVYNELHHIPRSRRPKAMVAAQVARTEQLREAGGIVSIVTHPERDLSERPEFLEVYDEYLSYLKTCPDIWFATAGELFRYWTGEPACPDRGMP
jgi:peptidoglycan/xylan/chitin deacetylase (PgdA/CDA1 family)